MRWAIGFFVNRAAALIAVMLVANAYFGTTCRGGLASSAIVERMRQNFEELSRALR